MKMVNYSEKIFCLDCWAKAKKKGKGPYWKNKQAAPKEKPQPSKDECALEVLRAHVDKEIESKQYCYLLALYLERSRQFMLEKDLKRKKMHLCIMKLCKLEKFLVFCLSL